MSDKTGIEWADATWNPIVGCSIVSKGCTNCYAMKVAHRLLDNPGHPHYHGTTMPTKNGGVWTGKMAIAPEHIITQPIRWTRPRRVFVNSMGDLFHEDVPREWIDRVFHIMALTPWHTYMVLTKRARRMQEYLSDPDTQKLYPGLPLPNVWLGVSIEDQDTANDRVPWLLRTPAAVRFVSAEPLLGPVNLRALRADRALHGSARGPRPKLDWVICGGESGKDARPMHPDWACTLRDQCAETNTPFFFKQWGEWIPWEWEHPPYLKSQNGQAKDRHELPNNIMDDPPGWDSGMGYVGEAESHAVFQKVGKKKAGRLLDGRTHDDHPATERPAA